MIRLSGGDIPLAGLEVSALAYAEDSMRIPDHLIKSVGFVSRYDPTPDGGSSIKFGGTAFIVAVPTEDDPTWALAHLVTAKHVAEAIDPAEAIIAMNATDGLPRYIRSGDVRWFYHPTEPDSVDVAVLPFGTLLFDDYDFTWVPELVFCTDQRIKDFDIGLGDELIIIGLFTRFFGTKVLTPIVRTGNLAMMPSEKLPSRDFGPMEAYLAEGRSIGGLSGSPVFVRNTVKMPAATADGQPSSISGLGGFHLLGLMHGHWDVPAKFSESAEAEAVNMGVSIVVPAKKILETLYHPELIAMRREHCQKEKSKGEKASPKPDSAFDSADPHVFTEDDFEQALKQVSRRVGSSESDKGSE